MLPRSSIAQGSNWPNVETKKKNHFSGRIWNVNPSLVGWYGNWRGDFCFKIFFLFRSWSFLRRNWVLENVQGLSEEYSIILNIQRTNRATKANNHSKEILQMFMRTLAVPWCYTIDSETSSSEFCRFSIIWSLYWQCPEYTRWTVTRSLHR